jgi:hypothetical protein
VPDHVVMSHRCIHVQQPVQGLRPARTRLSATASHSVSSRYTCANRLASGESRMMGNSDQLRPPPPCPSRLR